MANASLISKIIFLSLAGFLSAFIDSIAGGGGMISLPAYLIVGFPTHYTLGTNKFSSTSGTITSTIKFFKSGNLDLDVLKILLPFTLIGTTVGVRSVLALDPSILKPIVLILLLGVGISSLISKDFGLEDKYKGRTRKNLILGCILAFSMGFYDGFFGPGTGSLLIYGLVEIYGFTFLRAAGNAKAMNLTSNIVSLLIFAINGKIYYLMGIPMGIFMIIGARVGANLAIKEGSKFVRPFFLLVTMAVAIKILGEILI